MFRVGVVRAHQDVVKKLLPVPRLGLVSAAMDGTLVATDIHKCQVVRKFEGHSRGLYALDYCGAEKFMVCSLRAATRVTCGDTCCVVVWCADCTDVRTLSRSRLGSTGKCCCGIRSQAGTSDISETLETALPHHQWSLWQ